jgi:hypothetical protein
VGIGGYVQAVTAGRLKGHDVALLRVRIPGETLNLLVASSEGIGFIDEAGRARLRAALREGAPSGLQARLRAKIEGARLLGVRADAVSFEREGHRWRLATEEGGTIVLVEATEQGEAAELGRAQLDASGAAMMLHLTEGVAIARRVQLERALTRARGRVARRVEAVRGDLSRCEEADWIAERARLFVAEAARAPRGAKTLVAMDWSSGKEEPIELALDPSKSAREQIDAMFRRARRLKEGAAIVRERLRESEGALAVLEGVTTELARAETGDLDALEARARAAAPRDFALATKTPSAPGRHREARARSPYRTFASGDGERILVGRGAAHNDALTFHVSRPHDLWLHAKDRVGAHVVVPLKRGAVCSPERLVEAAHLAAHFSEAKDEAIVDVQYTPRKFVRKPKGSAPGFVIVDREKVIVLRREAATLRRLLESESLE